MCVYNSNPRTQDDLAARVEVCELHDLSNPAVLLSLPGTAAQGLVWVYGCGCGSWMWCVGVLRHM